MSLRTAWAVLWDPVSNKMRWRENTIINPQSSERQDRATELNRHKCLDWAGFSMSVRPTTLITPGKPFSGKLPPHTLEAKVYNIHQLHRGLLVLASQPLSTIPSSYPSPMSNSLASPKPSWSHPILTIPVWTYWSEKKVQVFKRKAHQYWWTCL